MTKGCCGIVVYADDFVVCFQYKLEAEQFYKRIEGRMEHFGLSLEKEKSRLIEFGRFAERDRKNRNEGKTETFTFLGFTHYCGHSRSGKFRVKRKTSKKKFYKKVKEVDSLLRNMVVVQGFPKQKIIMKLNQIFTGYFHYYGITDNYNMLFKLVLRIKQCLFKWLNRRSQRKSFNWDSFKDMLKIISSC